jgi:hypothetical protein
MPFVSPSCFLYKEYLQHAESPWDLSWLESGESQSASATATYTDNNNTAGWPHFTKIHTSTRSDKYQKSYFVRLRTSMHPQFTNNCTGTRSDKY